MISELVQKEIDVISGGSFYEDLEGYWRDIQLFVVGGFLVIGAYTLVSTKAKVKTV